VNHIFGVEQELLINIEDIEIFILKVRLNKMLKLTKYFMKNKVISSIFLIIFFVILFAIVYEEKKNDDIIHLLKNIKLHDVTIVRINISHKELSNGIIYNLNNKKDIFNIISYYNFKEIFSLDNRDYNLSFYFMIEYKKKKIFVSIFKKKNNKIVHIYASDNIRSIYFNGYDTDNLLNMKYFMKNYK